MNLEEIERAMEAHTDTYTYPGRDPFVRAWDWAAWAHEHDSAEHAVADLGIVSVVETVGGHEGDGEYMSLVFSVTDCGSVRYYRKVGHYSSWDAPEWDGDLTEVHPVVREVTFYE